jgi:16S rRNA processing protein RimM
MAAAGERLVVARVRGFHGLRGTVRLEPLTDRAGERFAPGATLFAEGGVAPLTVAESAPEGSGWRVRFAELPDRTAAESLRGAFLEAVIGEGETLAEGEFYWHQVVGAAVRDLDGTELGVVRDVYRAGGAEVLLVAGAGGEIDVPVVRALVSVFEPDRGRIVVDGEALGLHGRGVEEATGPEDGA